MNRYKLNSDITKNNYYIYMLLMIQLILQSCTASTALNGQPGSDINSIVIGISRVEVEENLGPSIRQWKGPTNICYSVYIYDAGVPPSGHYAFINAFRCFLSFGLTEVYALLSDDPTMYPVRKTEKIAISYSAEGNVVGVFDKFNDFDELPLEGTIEK